MANWELMTALAKKPFTASACLNQILVVAAESAVSCSVASDSSLQFAAQGDDGLYGNNVTARYELPASSNSSSYQSHVDFDNPLPESTTLELYVFANSTLSGGSEAVIQLQIWRPWGLNNTTAQFVLVWSRSASVGNGTGLYTVH